MVFLAPPRPKGGEQAVCPLAAGTAANGLWSDGFDLGAVLSRHDLEISRRWALELKALRCHDGLATLIECTRTEIPRQHRQPPRSLDRVAWVVRISSVS